MSKVLNAAIVGLGLSRDHPCLSVAQQKPAELKIGMTTFLSGPAAVFGIPGKAAAESRDRRLSMPPVASGASKSRRPSLDEGVGGDELLSEYRRVVQEDGVKVMLSVALQRQLQRPSFR